MSGGGTVGGCAGNLQGTFGGSHSAFAGIVSSSGPPRSGGYPKTLFASTSHLLRKPYSARIGRHLATRNSAKSRPMMNVHSSALRFQLITKLQPALGLIEWEKVGKGVAEQWLQ
jgi:hypothetical protein